MAAGWLMMNALVNALSWDQSALGPFRIQSTVQILASDFKPLLRDQFRMSDTKEIVKLRENVQKKKNLDYMV